MIGKLFHYPLKPQANGTFDLVAFESRFRAVIQYVLRP
jgi:hypothetical protein